jgi:hypothetical protein
MGRLNVLLVDDDRSFSPARSGVVARPCVARATHTRFRLTACGRRSSTRAAATSMSGDTAKRTPAAATPPSRIRIRRDHLLQATVTAPPAGRSVRTSSNGPSACAVTL